MDSTSKYQPYPSYKDSGVEWLGQVPVHWSVGRIKNDYFILGGSTPKSGVGEFWDGDITWVTPADLNKEQGIVINQSKRNITKEGLNSCGTKLVPMDSVILSTRAPIGTLGIAGKDLCTNQGCKALVPNKSLNSKYLAYLLLTIPAELNVRGRGTTFLELSSDDLGSVKMPLLSLKEQNQIVSFLDQETGKMDLLLEKQQAMIEFLKEKRQAVISHAVTQGLNPNAKLKDSGIQWLGQIPEHWKLSNLRYIFKFGKGLTITKANLQDEGIPCVSYGEVHSKFGFEVSIEKHHLKCVSKDYLDTSKFALLKQGDFVFADTSEDLEGAGNFTHVSSSSLIFAGYHTIIAKQVYKHNYRFLAYLMDSTVFRNQIQLAVKGVKVFSITQAILRAATVWLPEVEEQKEIADYLDTQTQKIDTLIEKSQQAIDLLKERKTALISAAVTGKVDLREYTNV